MKESTFRLCCFRISTCTSWGWKYFKPQSQNRILASCRVLFYISDKHPHHFSVGVTFLFVVFIWVSKQDYKFLLPVNFNLAVKAWAKPEITKYYGVRAAQQVVFFSTLSKHVTNARKIMPTLQIKLMRLKSDESTQSQWRLSGTIL